MLKEKKIFIFGSILYLLSVLAATILPYILKFFDLYYFIPIENYRHLVLTLAIMGLLMFLASDKYYSKELIILFFGILIVLSLKFLPI